MHIFLAALAHETNSFSPIPTTLRSFGEGILYRPGATADSHAAALGFPGFGFLLDVAAQQGDRVTTGLCAWAQPGGPVARHVYEALATKCWRRSRPQGQSTRSSWCCTAP